MDYLCLYICSKILHRKMRLWRIVVAAAIGGGYSIISLFLPISSAAELFLDCAVCVLMCAIVYSERGRGMGSFALSSFLYIGISMMTGGCMTAIFNLLNKLDLPLDSVEADGISTYLFAALALAAGIISLGSGKVISRRAGVKECTLHIGFCGKQFEFHGICDSGNLVREPIGGKTVIFIDRAVIEKKQALDFMDKFLKGELSESAPCRSLRIISFKTASGSSCAAAALPECIRAEFQDKRGKTVSLELDAFICPSDIGKSAQGFDAVIPEEIIKL